ncbi:MAG: BamA/TamA family outer membrane protein [Oligoflexia bacterium]|nr:BamA/TamA family outer membrane protein [Oligoflexia bacterium]
MRIGGGARLALALALGADVAHGGERLCPGLRFEGELQPGLSETEHRLLCGDPRSEAWGSIPTHQARFHFRNFLQKRGYLHPSFIAEGTTEGVGTLVRIGTPTLLSRIRTQGAPEELRIERRRKLLGRPVTPTLLNEIEQWVYRRLQAAGHPCPDVETLADRDSGEVLVQMRPGPQAPLSAVIEEKPVPGTLPGIFRRYDAFQLGDRFNGDWLAVTANRINAQDVVLNVHFTPECSPAPDPEKGVTVRQSVTPGPPRLMSFGFGIDTEGLLLARAAWRHSRLGRGASWLDFTALGSAREQLLEATLEWFHLARPSRQSLRPSLLLRHRNERPFETLEARGGIAFSTSADGTRAGLVALAGPSIQGLRTYRGVGPRDSRFLSLDAEATLTSHAFEYYSADPRTGYRLGAAASLGSRALLSTVSAQRAELRGEVLLNYRDFDPPLLVLGFRGALAATFTAERPGAATGLPASFFHFLGGSSNLRGFGRQELPKDGLGGLTSAFLNSELRLGSTLPWNLDPFVFLDLGALGRAPLALDPPIYHSPGAGLRWLSPIGVFRTTLARGFPADVPGHWQLFISFAEEF